MAISETSTGYFFWAEAPQVVDSPARRDNIEQSLLSSTLAGETRPTVLLSFGAVDRPFFQIVLPGSIKDAFSSVWRNTLGRIVEMPPAHIN